MLSDSASRYNYLQYKEIVYFTFNSQLLCQVFLENSNQPGKYTVPLQPVCSKPIFDAKAKKTLQIMDISESSAPAEGGKKIIILCERVARDDIKV